MGAQKVLSMARGLGAVGLGVCMPFAFADDYVRKDLIYISNMTWIQGENK